MVLLVRGDEGRRRTQRTPARHTPNPSLDQGAQDCRTRPACLSDTRRALSSYHMSQREEKIHGPLEIGGLPVRPTGSPVLVDPVGMPRVLLPKSDTLESGNRIKIHSPGNIARDIGNRKVPLWDRENKKNPPRYYRLRNGLTGTYANRRYFEDIHRSHYRLRGRPGTNIGPTPRKGINTIFSSSSKVSTYPFRTEDTEKLTGTRPVSRSQ